MSSFGQEFEKIWPTTDTPLRLSNFGKKLLKLCEDIKKPEQKEIDMNAFKLKSSNFPLEVIMNKKERRDFKKLHSNMFLLSVRY